MAASGIDAHAHLWTYSPTAHVWMDPARQSSLMRDYTIGELASLMLSAGVRGVIAVQASQTLAETDFLLALADRPASPIVGVVGWVDLCSPSLPAQLSAYAGARALVGVRHVVHDEVDDLFMARPAFRAGIAALAAHGLAYDLLLFPKHLPLAATLAADFPDVRFVLDHCGNPDIRRAGRSEAERAQGLAEWEAGLRALAALPNVHCKLSGLVTRADWRDWAQADLDAVLGVVVSAFGPSRCMQGSDWPVCTLSADYAATLGAVASFAQRHLSAEEAAEVAGGTAARVYRRRA